MHTHIDTCIQAHTCACMHTPMYTSMPTHTQHTHVHTYPGTHVHTANTAQKTSPTSSILPEEIFSGLSDLKFRIVSIQKQYNK